VGVATILHALTATLVATMLSTARKRLLVTKSSAAPSV
jgi:hypothetical protein